jgi:hypothetical protein
MQTCGSNKIVIDDPDCKETGKILYPLPKNCEGYINRCHRGLSHQHQARGKEPCFVADGVYTRVHM